MLGQRSRFCPVCFRSYPESETQCRADGAELLSVFSNERSTPAPAESTANARAAAAVAEPPVSSSTTPSVDKPTPENRAERIRRALESAPQPLPPFPEKPRVRSGIGKRRNDLVAGGIAFSAVVAIVVPGLLYLRPAAPSEMETAEQTILAGMPSASAQNPPLEQAEGLLPEVPAPVPREPEDATLAMSPEPIAEPAATEAADPNLRFAELQMQASLHMRAFEESFKRWVARQTPESVEAMRKATHGLDAQIVAAREEYQGHAMLWRAHYHLQRALILNATGPREQILPAMKSALKMFRLVQESGDEAAIADLPQSLANASGTYKFVFGTNVDPLFEPMVASAPGAP
ncbi:MAG TPA: hypothetical protein VM328_09755 [Fimbriimonadaceae bacterium]|nr:hypothetical protein [Fimbriimonadaceae bacterium]